jgi:hypothetical protein
MAIENKPAGKYAKNSASVADGKGAVVDNGSQINALRPSIGGIFKSQPGTKTDGIKIRGTGAATKGIMARGPMA